jgi:hypothetical protein
MFDLKALLSFRSNGIRFNDPRSVFIQAQLNITINGHKFIKCCLHYFYSIPIYTSASNLTQELTQSQMIVSKLDILLLISICFSLWTVSAKMHWTFNQHDSSYFFKAVDVIRQSGNSVVFTVQSLIAFEGGSSAADESTQQVII